MLGALLIATSISLSPIVIADRPPADGSPAATATPAPDPAQIAQREFAALAQGSIDRAHFTPRLTNSLSDAQIASTEAQLATLGDLKRMGLNAARRIDGENVYVYILVCANGNVRMTLALDQTGLIDGLFFQPWPCTVSANCSGWPWQQQPPWQGEGPAGYEINPNSGYNPPPDPPAPR